MKREHARGVAVIVAAVAGANLPGCAWQNLRSTPGDWYTGNPPPTCDHRTPYHVGDFAIAAGMLGLGAVMFFASGDLEPEARAATGAVMIGGAGVFAASGVYGLQKRPQCADAWALHHEREDERHADTQAVPIMRVGLLIQNEYAESMFRVQTTAAGDRARGAAHDVRAEAGETVSLPEAVACRPGQPVQVAVQAMSLGRWHRFNLVAHCPEDGEGALLLRYDWDAATGAFRVRHGWR